MDRLRRHLSLSRAVLGMTLAHIGMAVAVIALTGVLDDSVVVGAVRAGAIGYLLKDAKPDSLCRAVRSAALKQVELSPAVAERLVREMRAPENPDSLTTRESEILRYVATGLSNKEIANRLHVGEKTVKTHVSNILAKLGLQSRTQAALYAVRNGLTSGPPLETGSESTARPEQTGHGRVEMFAPRRPAQPAAHRVSSTRPTTSTGTDGRYGGSALRSPA